MIDKHDNEIIYIYILQLFRLNVKGQLAVGERCINTVGSNDITIQFCPVEPTGPWILRDVSDKIWFLICFSREF